MANVQWPQYTLGGIAADVFLVELTLCYKKSEELQLGPAAFLQGGPKKVLTPSANLAILIIRYKHRTTIAQACCTRQCSVSMNVS